MACSPGERGKIANCEGLVSEHVRQFAIRRQPTSKLDFRFGSN
jgi:hypothetical protein